MVWMITLEKKYCEAIIDGRKKIVIRNRIPRTIVAGDAILVCMKGSKGRVPLFFEVDIIAYFSPKVLWAYNEPQLAIDKEDYFVYTKGKNIVYGIRIRSVYRYNHEVNISDFGVQKTPKWFTYVPCGRTALMVGSVKGD